jgi:2'-5' RNA ligase
VKVIAAQVARDLEGQVVRVVLDVAEYWKKAHLVCATTRASLDPAACILAETLKSRLATAGFASDLKPFRPHITLARDVRHAPGPATMEPVKWSFTDFALVDSKTRSGGSVYTVVEKFAFGRRH